ncbi:MAG TPA: hypothetical protein VHS75_11700 [Phenylobacterium sp.]|nr:hypothetical protein [Phenylobacterium sp.]
MLVKRLLRGSKANRFDLESIIRETRRDCRLRWAAHLTAIIPPPCQARRIIRSHAAGAYEVVRVRKSGPSIVR